MKVFGFLRGQQKIFKDLKTLGESINSPLAKALAVGAMKVQATARKSIQLQHGTSVRKRINGRMRTLKVSKPGEPPTTKTGTLVRSIFWNITPSEMKAVVGSPLLYAMWLEYGTKHMDARPWLKPALDAQRIEIQRLTGEALKTIMKKVIK